NDGPTSLFGASDTGPCLNCHNQGGVNAIGGRFPEVSNAWPEYCSTILQQSFGLTMPFPTPAGAVEANFPAYQTLKAACLAPPGPGSNPSQKMMSFDPPPEQFWTAQTGTLSQNTSIFTEGTASMAVNASGYVRLDSGSFSTWQL